MRNYQEIYQARIKIPRDPVDPGSGSETSSDYDPCEYVDAGDRCKTFAQIEGNGSYTLNTNGTAGASGRYQIEQTTAVGEMASMGIGSSYNDRVALWQKCRSSASAECAKLQDDICNNYAAKMKGKTMREAYLSWNMGPTGASQILNAHAAGTMVTNPDRIRKMDNQAWSINNPSGGDTTKFLNGLNDYMRKRGVDPMRLA